MPVRRFLCDVVGDGTTTDFGANPFRPSIGRILDTAPGSGNWKALDLRTWSEQTSKSGLMLVICDIPDSLLPALRAEARILTEVTLEQMSQYEDLKRERDRMRRRREG